MRVLVCNPNVPHPSKGASAVLFYHYISAMKRAGFDILNFLLIEKDDSDSVENLDPYRSDLEEDHFRVVPYLSDNLVHESALKVWLNEAVLKRMNEEAARFAADVVVSFDILSAWATKTLPAPARVTWLGDLNFQTHWYRAKYGLREGLIKRRNAPWVFPLVAARCHAWKRIYTDVLRDHHRVIVSSKSSEHALGKLGISSTYQPYPWPNEEDRFALTLQKPLKPNFGFFGNLEALGSRSALHFMTEQLYPKALERWGDGGFTIRLAGTGQLPDWAGRQLRGKPEIEAMGFVDDLDQFLRSSHAMLAPIDIPVGNRSRIVTAMAKGCLVIAHRNAALGNPDLIHEETCLLADDANGFVNAMERAARPDRNVRKIVEAARGRYLECFQPDRATSRMMAVLCGMGEAPGSTKERGNTT